MDGGIGHNQPPTPTEAVAAENDAILIEAQNWCDGEPITTEAQLNDLDKLIKAIRSYKTAIGKAGKEQTGPFHDVWKAEVAKVKTYADDAQRILDSLVETGAPYRAKLAAEKEAAKQAAWREAKRKEQAARELAQQAQAGSIDDRRDAESAIIEAKKAKVAASKASKDTVKGMRTVTKSTINSHKEALAWIYLNDQPAIISFIEDYVRRNQNKPIDGVTVTTEKEAY